jgi:glycosyltransferase involved in cell wall biosynthesis
MRIGFDLRPALKTNSRRRGIGRYTSSLFGALQSVNQHFEFVAYTLGGQACSVDLSGCELRRLFYLKYPSRLNWLFEPYLFQRAIQKDRLDLFHATDVTAIPRSERGPVLATVHDLIPWVFWEETVKSVPKDFTYALKLARKRIASADWLLTSSKYSKQDIADRLGFPPDRIEVTYLGCSSRILSQDESIAREKLRELYQLEGPFLFYVGGSDFRKNLPFLIRVFSRAREEGYPGKLVLAGETFCWDVPEIRGLKRLISKCGVESSVVFPGYVEDDVLSSFYSSCDFFVFPSLYEGFGIPVAEALKCGAPLLLSDRTSIPEVAGDCAFYFDPENENDFLAVLREALESGEKVQEFRVRGMERAARFTWERTAADVLALYQKIGDRKVN